MHIHTHTHTQHKPCIYTLQDLRAQMATAGRSCMSMVLPFASSVIAGGGGENSMGEIYFALSKAIDVSLAQTDGMQ